MTEQKPKRHRHDQSMWLIAGGNWMWCYQCGAIRTSSAFGERWEKPTGIGGENPAMRLVRTTDGKISHHTKDSHD